MEEDAVSATAAKKAEKYQRLTFRSGINYSVSKDQPTPPTNQVSGTKFFFDVWHWVFAFRTDETNRQILSGKFYLLDLRFISVGIGEGEGLGDGHDVVVVGQGA
ncbi:hypothetical protein FRB91_009532 [Serendipita sp. 411]|nr:hypothetical protein FRC19_011680 [Serendipita sp. 401]KAG8849900.1 hypothetical protein FRB91_009532 [Serendipita sp. 411]